MAANLLDGRLVDERADVDIREPVRHLEPAHSFREAPEEAVVDAFLHEQRFAEMHVCPELWNLQ
jgi:hypothetical protein